MTEKRTPYTTATKPRQPWPGETGYIPARISELEKARLRIAALEAAARAVVEAYEREDELLLLFREIEALGRVLGEVEG